MDDLLFKYGLTKEENVGAIDEDGDVNIDRHAMESVDVSRVFKSRKTFLSIVQRKKMMLV